MKKSSQSVKFYEIYNVCNYVLLLLYFVIAFQPSYVHANAEFYNKIETKLEQVPKRLQQFSNIAFPDGIPDLIINKYTLPHINVSSLCGKQSNIYREALKEFQSWAVRMVDSSGKVPTAIMEGHFHDMGSYGECLKTAEKSPYPLQHCVVEYGNIWDLPKNTNFDWEATDTIIGGMPFTKPRIHIAYCLPASCSIDEIQSNYKKLLNRYNVTVHMNEYSCTASNEDSPPTTSENIAVIIFTILGLLVLSGTFMDLFYPKGEKITISRKMLECWSFYGNGKVILKTTSPDRSLAVLNGIKSISIFWILISHHYLFNYINPIINYMDFRKLFEKPYAFLATSGILAVDIFLVISGLLQSYLFLITIKKVKKFNYIIYCFHRLIRILPCYMVTILFCYTLLPRYLGSGPRWKLFAKTVKNNCHQNWWTNLLFINNYVGVYNQCIPSTWYLSVDMQLYFISPLFLFAIYKYKSFIKFGIPTCIFLSTAISFLNSYLGGYPAGALLTRDWTTVFKFQREHIPTHTRMTGWLVGLGLGYLIEKNQREKITLSPIVIGIVWILALLSATFVLQIVSYFSYQDVIKNQIIHSLVTALLTTIWTLSVAWIIFACEIGYGGPFHLLLSWRFFQPLGRISFLMYLIHVAIQFIQVGSMKTSPSLEIFPVSIAIIGEMCITVFFSFMASLYIEAPFIQMEKLLITGMVNKEKRRAEHEMNSRPTQAHEESTPKQTGPKILDSNHDNSCQRRGINGTSDYE